MTGHQLDATTIIENLKKMGMTGEKKEQSESQLYKNAVSRYRVGQTFHNVFNTEDGKAVLNHLMDQTLRRPCWNKELPSDHCMPQGLHREGQNSIMQLILNYMAIAESPPPTEPKKSNDIPLN